MTVTLSPSELAADKLAAEYTFACEAGCGAVVLGYSRACPSCRATRPETTADAQVTPVRILPARRPSLCNGCGGLSVLDGVCAPCEQQGPRPYAPTEKPGRSYQALTEQQMNAWWQQGRTG